MSECDTRDHPVSVVFVVVFKKLVIYFNFFLFQSQTAAQICIKLCVDAPLVDRSQVHYNQASTPIFD